MHTCMHSRDYSMTNDKLSHDQIDVIMGDIFLQAIIIAIIGIIIHYLLIYYYTSLYKLTHCLSNPRLVGGICPRGWPLSATKRTPKTAQTHPQFLGRNSKHISNFYCLVGIA